jgi:hypothetical protein
MNLQEEKRLMLFKRIANDRDLLTSHISLFAALYICWQRKDFSIPFPVTRKELMSYSKIASSATYHKCIRELQERGYIRYEPSFHPRIGSLIYWKTE